MMANNGQQQANKIQLQFSKLCKFSNENGTTNTNEFIQEAKLLLALW